MKPDHLFSETRLSNYLIPDDHYIKMFNTFNSFQLILTNQNITSIHILLFQSIFFRRPMRSNEPTNNQHFFHSLLIRQSSNQTKPQPWSNCQVKLIQLTIRPNDRGKERFRETLVELSIETNFNFF